jgi:hypothetical protein
MTTWITNIKTCFEILLVFWVVENKYNLLSMEWRLFTPKVWIKFFTT